MGSKWSLWRFPKSCETWSFDVIFDANQSQRISFRAFASKISWYDPFFEKIWSSAKSTFDPQNTLQMGTFGPLGVVKTPVFTKIISRVPSIHFKNSQREPHRTRFSLSNANFVFEIWPGYVQVTWATKSDFGCFGPPNPPKTPIFWGFWS